MNTAALIRRGERIVRAHFIQPGAIEALGVYFALVAAKDHPDDPGRLAALSLAIDRAQRAAPRRHRRPRVSPSAPPAAAAGRGAEHGAAQA